MEFRNLRRQYEVHKGLIDEAVASVCSSSAFIHGPAVEELEGSLASYVGVKHCISCGNGTDALMIALKVWGIGPGDAVFVPDFTFFASAEVVALVGATPVFVDVHPETFNISFLDLVEKIAAVRKAGKLTPKAIIAVDLFGCPAEMVTMKKVAEFHSLLLLEDGAQGFGGVCEGGRRACGLGHISTTSFFPAKPLGCYGDGGAIFTDSDQWASMARSLCVHGKGESKYDNVRLGCNSRLDTVQAAILQVKLKAFEEYELDAVNRVALKYEEAFFDIDEAGVVETPIVPDEFVSSWAQYTVKLRDEKERDSLKSFLSSRGIPSMIYYPLAMHEQKAFAPLLDNLGLYGDCPVATSLTHRVLSLPMGPYMTDGEVDKVISAVLEWTHR